MIFTQKLSEISIYHDTSSDAQLPCATFFSVNIFVHCVVRRFKIERQLGNLLCCDSILKCRREKDQKLSLAIYKKLSQSSSTDVNIRYLLDGSGLLLIVRMIFWSLVIFLRLGAYLRLHLDFPSVSENSCRKIIVEKVFFLKFLQRNMQS